MKLLQIFGPIISRVVVMKENESDIVWHPEIDRYVNEYCSDSLEELSLFSTVNITNAWRKPFKQLTDLYVNEKVVSCEDTNFTELFPLLS